MEKYVFVSPVKSPTKHAPGSQPGCVRRLRGCVVSHALASEAQCKRGRGRAKPVGGDCRGLPFTHSAGTQSKPTSRTQTRHVLPPTACSCASHQPGSVALRDPWALRPASCPDVVGPYPD